ncbi:MAG: hypothetical protein IPM53_06570 [Anaerolineaceae bacterium]|nr:hypothetical protein [Anaerolineaceae bacterium]
MRLFGGGRDATAASDIDSAVEPDGAKGTETAVQTPPRRPDICDPVQNP